MKKIQAVLLLFFLIQAVFAYTQPTRSDSGLKGPVHTVEIKQIALSEKLKSWFAGPKVPIEVLPITNPPEPLHRAEGVLFHRNWLEYHSSGVLMEDSHYHGSDAVDRRTLHHLNSDAKCELTEIVKSNPALNQRHVYQLGPSGFPVRREDRNSQDQIINIYEYVFDDQGRKREETELTPEGVVLKKWLYQYNENGSLASVNRYDPEGKQQVKRNYVYDDAGRLISEQILDAKNALSGGWDYSYDAAGNRVEEAMHSSKDGLESLRVFTYDERGSVASLTNYGQGGDVSLREAYRYQYDEQGNWIVKTAYSVVMVWNQPQLHLKQVDTRAIVYFPLP